MSVESEWAALSISKQKLIALLDKLDECIGGASDEACEVAFRKLSDFAKSAAEEQSRRLDRFRSPTLTAAPSTLRIRQRAKDPFLSCCDRCAAPYCKEQLCDECNGPFRWCFTGSSRTPHKDPLYPSGEVQSSICGECLKKRPVSPSRVLQQEEEYLRVVAIFSDPAAKWKWVSCLCEGSSLISLTWQSLKGLLFLLFPFYCQNISEHQSAENFQDPRFLDFVTNVAKCALFFLGHESLESVRVQAWQSVVMNPDSPSQFVDADFELVWKSVTKQLNCVGPTQIRIFGRKDHDLECLEQFGENAQASRAVNILKLNLGVAHFDFIVPIESISKAADVEAKFVTPIELHPVVFDLLDGV